MVKIINENKKSYDGYGISIVDNYGDCVIVFMPDEESGKKLVEFVDDYRYDYMDDFDYDEETPNAHDFADDVEFKIWQETRIHADQFDYRGDTDRGIATYYGGGKVKLLANFEI